MGISPRSGGLARGISRRQALRLLGLAVPATLALRAAPAQAMTSRVLAFHHTHTGERLEVTYWRGGGYDQAALASVNRLLRDFRTDEVHLIEPELLDVLHAVQVALRRERPFHVISGYRSPTTNETLRAGGDGVAKRSLHMEGRAIDVRLPGVPTSRLREAAVALALGGVGYYRKSDFVHLDTGRPRAW